MLVLLHASARGTTLQLRHAPVWHGFGLAALYYVGCVFAALPLQEGSVALLWPAAGVGLAGAVLYGVRHTWFVPLALLAYHATAGGVPDAFLPFSVLSNTLGTIAGGWLATRGPRHAGMGLPQAVVVLQGGLVLAAVSAVIGVAGLRSAGMLDADATGTGLLRWFLGDLLGVVAVTPALLLRPRPVTAGQNPYREHGSEPERLAWMVLLVASYLLMAWASSSGGTYALGVTALPLAMLTWCAMRLPPWWTARAVLCTCLLIGSFASLGLAGFEVPTGALDTARLLLFLCLLGALPLALALATHERRVAAQRLLRNATIDPITGLHNRTAFEQVVRDTLKSPGAPPRALAYLDLDHLKLVNDTASHAAGDALIRGVAGVLQASLRPGDAVGHFGGDEFGLLLHNCLPAAAEERARQFMRAIEAYRCDWEGRSLGVTASIGLVPFQGEQDFARLLSQADAACFAAKELGGNQICRAALDGGERLDRTRAMRWAVRVREAIDMRSFQLYGQTIAPLGSVPSGSAPFERAGRHFELLLRLRDPATGQLLLPEQFFPAADRYRLGVRIDRGVIDLALGWLEHNADPREIDTCCINLSAEALVDEGFIAFLSERLRRSAFPPEKLCLEITETSALRDIPRAQRFISQMRTRGCRFALDDFGTGFCSFGYLRSLDVDFFKIDGSFVREMHDSPLSLQIVRAINDIAHVLDKRSIAEHAETPAQLATLAELGVDFAQGYAVHRPEPIETYLAPPVTPSATPESVTAAP